MPDLYEHVIWRSWNDAYCASATCSSTATAWTNWVVTSTATTAISDATWTAWVSAKRMRPQPMTEEEQAERRERELARAAEAQQAAEARQAQMQAAARRARTLLRAHLSKEQRRSLRQHDYFELEAIYPDGSTKRFQINRGSHGNVYELDASGARIRKFCVQPDGIPTGDIMLAQKLWIETDPVKFERMANVTDLRTGRLQRAVA